MAENQTPDQPSQPEPQAPITDADRLALYLAAEKAILSGHQSYTVDGMTFTRADLFRVQQMIASLRQSQAAAAATGPGSFVGGIRTMRAVF